MRIQFLVAAIASMTLASCTVEKHGAELKSEFHEPFTSPSWKQEQLGNAAGEHICTVSSGHGGLTFVVRKRPGATVVSVQSNRYHRSGTSIIVTVNGHRYETGQPYFSAQDAVAMAEDFSAGEKAYVEWSELKAYNGRARYTTIIPLAGFKQKFEQCAR